MFLNRTSPSSGLARTLSKLGHCSRSQAAKLVRAGKVCLNGRVVRDPECRVVPRRDKILVDGHEVRSQKKIYFMMNKPRGFITTASDEKDRKTIYSLLPEYRQWLAPIGRLDKASEGLLLCTNDWALAEQITSPATHLDKVYHVQIGIIPDQAVLDRLAMGVNTEGDVLRAKSAQTLRSGGKNCWLEIVLDEGKNRHIRRMLAVLKIEVLRLIRVAIGPLQLGDLAKGKARELTPEEVAALKESVTIRIRKRPPQKVP
jgi:23S rRNA pseudouridine2605 synthase